MSTAALVAFGIAGKRAAALSRRPFSFKNALFDEVSSLEPNNMDRMAKVREVK